jgi:F-type H+-transporting ATPase subunit b
MLEFLAGSAHGAQEHAEAAAFGISFLTPGFFVALAMLVVFAIMLKARVPALIAKGLDARIAEIRKQLDEAQALRAEAEALRDDYAKKAREADKDIAGLKQAAEQQAEEIVKQAKSDASALIERHKVLSAGKIAAAERAAVDELRAKAADAAAAAAGTLIAEKHDAAADRRLVDQSISDI